MKNLITIFLLLSLATPAFADCNLATDIKVKPDYVEYTYECHRLVGKTFMDNEDRKAQIKSYEELVALQKEHLATETARTELWRGTAEQMQKDVASLEKARRYEGYVFFGAGVLTTILTVYAVRAASK